MKRVAHIILKTRTMRKMDWGVVKGPTRMTFYSLILYYEREMR